MKKVIVLFAIVVFAACSNNKARPDSAIETGREFIRASLDGDFKTAEALLVNDSENKQLFESYKRFYNKMPQQEKSNYKKASYQINKLDEVNDSTTVINYSNSYMKKPMDIKVVKTNGLWSVDFKFFE